MQSRTLCLLNAQIDEQECYIIYFTNKNDVIYTIVNIYTANTKQISFLHEVWKKVQKQKQGHILICGDFNLVPDTSVDIKGPVPKKACKSNLSTFLHTVHLICIMFGGASTPWKEIIPSYLLHPTNEGKLSNPRDISNTFCSYYSSLYNLKDNSSTPQTLESKILRFLESLNLPTQSASDLETLNAPITDPVIERAISLPNNKVPGPDGFSTKYYNYLPKF